MEKEQFENENYDKKVISVNIFGASLCCIVLMIGFGALFGYIFHLIWGGLLQYFLLSRPILFFIFILLCIVAHEGIHALFAGIYSEKGFKSIKLGIAGYKVMFSPYCHCREVLTIKQFHIVSLMPTVILGIIPVIIALFFCRVDLLFVGILMIGGGGGDILYSVKLLKEKQDDYIYELPNDENLMGLIVYRKK